MIGLRTRIRIRQATDRNAGHLAVEELVDRLISRHGGDSLLLGTVFDDALVQYRHAQNTLPLVDSTNFLGSALSSLAAYDKTLRTARGMESDGERAFVPLLLDLRRQVVAARTQHALNSMRSRNDRARAGRP